MRILCCIVLLAFANLSALPALSAEKKTADKPPANLRLLNTSVFGKKTTEPVVLLQPQQSGTLDPETVMVDISKGQYFAATVRYPRDMSFDAARKSLNSAYGKWEKEMFAAEPEMGIWRNEDEKFGIQLTQDAFAIVVIYINFELTSDEVFLRGLSRAETIMKDEKHAHQAVSEMRTRLTKKELKEFYELHCHKRLRDRTSETAFISFMGTNRGAALAELIVRVDDALQQKKGTDVIIAQHSDRDNDEYVFVLEQVKQNAKPGERWHLKLRKEDEKWKLKALD